MEERQAREGGDAPADSSEPTENRARAGRWIIALSLVVVGAIVIANLARLSERESGDGYSSGGDGEAKGEDPNHSERRLNPEYFVVRPPTYSRDHSFNSEAVIVWGGDHEYTDGLQQNTSISNIRPVDYAGAKSCIECHGENYDLWSNHAHRWMNVNADEVSVKGDFSGSEQARISYRRGLGEFYQKDGKYMMKLARDGVEREFVIERTLGSRVHQYYIGKLVSGPEEKTHPLRTEPHVLPFGYELTLKEWVPIVHATGQQGMDSERDDPFLNPSRLAYDRTCSMCHTTPPMGNLMLGMFKRFAAYSPRKIHFEGSNYIDEVHPGAVRFGLPDGQAMTPANTKQLVNGLTMQSLELMKPEKAASLGITCEACHLGAAAHVRDEKVLPLFFPSGPYVHTAGKDQDEIWGRSPANKNFTCARCHSGARPQFANGIGTWNSTEYTDAARGHCYQPEKAKARGMKMLTCVSCHNPHETIGRSWKKSAEADRQSCVRCHTQYEDPQVAQSHTRHPVGSEGSQCMNCHMPKINEGLGDMVRTHTIFKPTDTKMLESNQPNACNMCHVDKSIDWTLGYMDQWYGLKSVESSIVPGAAGYKDAAINESYPDRTKSAALGWLQSPHLGTRMVGADVLLKAKAGWALPQLLKTLDDPYMEARQFSVQRLRDYLGINTNEYGYKHYMSEAERREPIKNMLQALSPPEGVTPEEAGAAVPPQDD